MVVYLNIKQTQTLENMKSYSVELRVHTEDGEDYSEDHFDFETKAEAFKFAGENERHLHSIIEYKDDVMVRYL